MVGPRVEPDRKRDPASRTLGTSEFRYLRIRNLIKILEPWLLGTEIPEPSKSASNFPYFMTTSGRF